MTMLKVIDCEIFPKEEMFKLVYNNQQVCYCYWDGTKRWFLNGKRHREDGPAIEWANGTKEWWLNSKRHRVDGPAIERANGDKEWYLNGKELSHSEWKEEVVRL